MAPRVNITLMTVWPTLVTTTLGAKMVSIITLVFVSQVSLCSFHHKDEYHFDSTVQIRRNLTRNVFANGYRPYS